jgi:hypothetical protein
MGWWSLDDNISLEIGDEALDETYDYIKRISEIYERDKKRKIHLKELELLMTVVLSTSGNEYKFFGLDDTRIKKITIQTQKRPVRQKYSAGDIFYFPVNDEQFGFGRIYKLGGTWNLAEIFNYVDKTPLYSPDILESGRLFPPVLINPTEAFEEWRWKVIHSDNDFYPYDVEELAYVMGDNGNYKLVRVGEYKPFRNISNQEAKKFPIMEFRPLDSIEETIRTELQRQLKHKRNTKS